jgi:stage II sporulation protein D
VSQKRVLTSPAVAWVAAALGAWLVAVACGSVQIPAQGPGPVLPSPTIDGLVESPAVRVGILPEVARVSVGAPSGLRVLARAAGSDQPRWRDLDQATFVPAEVEGRSLVRLVETGEELAQAAVVPSDPAESVAADSRPYRGIFEILPADHGTLTVVNVVNVEDYLKGVVPNELSPKAFPQIEALKAQAVAARTWVLSHLGDYSSRGYDVCATAACQVYRGRASEQRLTDAAVDQTHGVIATWRGRPIHAYYTSTCGGHTENGDVIFHDRAPYLKGVVCTPERSARHSLTTSTEPRRDLPGGANVAQSLAVLQALGVVHEALDEDPSRLAHVPSDDEIRGWMTALEGALGRAGCESPVTGGLARRASFFEYAVASLCWRERADEVLATDEAGALLPFPDAVELTGDGERRATALLVHEGLVGPRADGHLHPDGTLSRAEVLEVLAGLSERGGVPAWRRGELAGLDGRALTVLQGEEAETLTLDPGARLFREHEGVYAGARELRLGVGDEVHYIARHGRIVYLEAHETRPGEFAASYDTRHYRWEAQLTPGDVARKVARYGSVGQVLDLVPQRLGVSGRVVELEIKGSEGDLLLEGLRVRWGLGLRENLFVIDRERDDTGAVDRFVFSGKGWGHGVGLCQVGAFGMAQDGATFTDILKHYYTGIQLTSLEPSPPPEPISMASRAVPGHHL